MLKIPWFSPTFLPDMLKKKICRYLLQRYLGQFLEEKLTLEQLKIDISNGTGTINDVTLYCQTLNELCEAQEWGIEVIGGRIGSVTVTIPWNALMTEDSFLEVNELFITLRPHVRLRDDGTSMLESVWSSMSSSMQLAQECLEKEGGFATAQSNVMEGIERFAQTIDNVLNRAKARLTNTEIRLEYLPPDNSRGIALIIKIEKIEYQNEAGNDPPDKENVNNDDNQRQTKQKTFLISTYATHHIVMEGITFLTEEFSVHNLNNKKTPVNEDSLLNEQFYSTISTLPDREQFNSNIKQQQRGDQDDSECEDETEIEIFHTEQIVIGKLSNRQEIRIKMKQAENIPGPKVQLELTLGSFALFLTPRQLHLLLSLSDILLSEDSSQAGKNNSRDENTQQQQYPMEIDIRKDTSGRFNSMTGGLGLHHGWSSDAFNETYESFQFTNPAPSIDGLSDSVISTSSSMTSSMASSATSQSTQNSRKGRRRRHIDLESNADISEFNIKISCLSIVLLHEDVLIECSSPLAESPVSEQSVQKLKSISDNYFNKIGIINIGLGANDLNNTMKLIDEGCRHYHLRLLCAPIVLDGEEQRNINGIQLRLTVTVGRADIREVLKDIFVPLLYFPKDKTMNQIRPDIMLNYNQLQKAIRSLGGRRFAPPKVDLNISLAACETEFDISIVDRLNGVLNSSPFTCNSNCHENLNNSKKNVPKTSINIESSSIDFRLRFPIADLRPIHDPLRIPWWERNIRDDFLICNFQQVKIFINPFDRFDITSNEINIHYCENIKSNLTHIGRVKFFENPSTRFSSAAIEYPKITLEFLSDEILIKKSPPSRSSDEENGGTSGESIGITTNVKESTPFTSRRICRESDTPHNKTTTDDPETLLIPGDRAEMDKFCTSAMNSSKIQINLNLPIVCVQLKSKHLYEVIYNRINSDLLMWEPSAPNYSKSQPIPMATSLLNAGMMDSIYMPYAMCTSRINYDSSSSATNSETDSDNDIYYSISDKQKKSIHPVSVNKNNFNTLSFRLNIKQGMITMFAPVRDSLNHVIPGQLGEFVLKIKTAYLFSVAGFHGNDNIGYLCLQAKSGEIYHCGLIPGPSSDPPLRLIGCLLPTHLQSTLYPIPNDLVQNELKGNPDREMIALAIQIKANPEQKRKRIRVTAGIQLTTLRHHFTFAQHTWITQLTDMFDVIDYPVHGYTPSGVVTELHLHLWDCAIDYRPLYFPNRAIATLGSLMITSNIATASSGCTLRFVAEDCTLSLAPHNILKKGKQRSSENKITSLPSEDLVCIVDLGLFEISLRLNEKATLSFPKFDLRTSINDVHIRTCSDSGNALAQFISYLASEGDFQDVDDKSTESDTMSIASESETDLLSVKSSNSIVPEVTHSQQQHVNTLMADAMEESISMVSVPSDAVPTTEGVEIFFFPDETNTNLLQRKLPLKIDSIGTSDDITLTSSIESIDECKKTKLKHRTFSTEFDDDSFANMFGPNEVLDDNDSINTEMRELLDFETSVMGVKSFLPDTTEAVEAFPQVTLDLGDITKFPSQLNQIKTVTTARKISSDTDEDFCFIAEEEKVNYTGQMQEVPTSEEPIRIIDNHFSVPFGKPDLLKAPQDFPMAVMRYTLCEMSLVWHIYGGRDFLTEEEKKQKNTKAGSQRHIPRYHNLPMSDAYKMGVSFSKGSPKIQFGPSDKLTWKTRGGVLRKHDVLMEIIINKVRFSHETYPTYTEQASRQVLLITELEIRDKLEVSNINKFLYHPIVGPKSKHGSHHMVVLKALHLRPDPTLPAQECCLRISLLPLRLNIDQDSLEFLVSFFSELGADGELEDEYPKQQMTPSHQAPVMMVEIPEAQQELQARKMVSENLLLLMEEEEKHCDSCESSSETNESTPIYFRNIVFSPDVPIRIDYHGKRVEFNRGPLAGLLMGLGQLQCSEIKLKAISHRHGILGVDRLLSFMLHEWLQDIKRNQLPSILSGVGPMHSLVQLFQGIRDLFWLPIEQYQKDGRIVRGLQLGAQSFTARTALAALEITTRIIHLLQITAETAYDMVSPGPSVRRGRGNRKGKRKRFNPPQDIREGVATAYQIVRDGIGETAHQIVEVAALEHDQKGYTGAVGAVVRQIPPTVVRPLVLATQATSKVLGGVRNQLVPEARIESREKWKDDEDEFNGWKMLNWPN